MRSAEEGRDKGATGGEWASARDYWLGRCEGFRVDSPAGRIGFVEDVLFRSRSARPETLAVRAGLFGRRLLLVSIESVEEVIPSRQRIVLRGSPELLGTAGLADARAEPSLDREQR